MKILLIKNSKENIFPHQIPHSLQELSVPYDRLEETIHYFQNLALPNMIKSEEFSLTKVKTYKNQVCRVQNLSDYYFYFSEKDEQIVVYRIKNVNTNRPWTIRKVGENEHIHYFKANENYKILNHDIMYGKYI